MRSARLGKSFVISALFLTCMQPDSGLAQSCRDDFDGSTQGDLSPAWTIVRQSASTWSLTGGRLRIELDYGDLWQNWTNNCRNMFLRAAPSGDFAIETSLSVSLVGNINQAHILLYSSDDNYLRFGPVLSNGTVYLDHVHEVGGSINQQYAAVSPGSSVFLRITKFGNSATMQYSQNGSGWTTLGTVASLGFTPTKVGVVAFDGSEPASSSVAQYDYFSVKEASGSLLFREGAYWSWQPEGDHIPGWDHVGIGIEGDVYESHPGYTDPTYWDPDCGVSVQASDINGVQKLHTDGSFLHDSPTLTAQATVTDVVPLPTDISLQDMRAALESHIGAPFLYLCPGPIDSDWLLCQSVQLDPLRQKGRIGGAFTCVGLIERCAEDVGYNNGEGFVPDRMEQTTELTDPGVKVPLLSPQLLAWCVGGSNPTTLATSQWLSGLFDPVDFLVIDPQGRRLGYTTSTGELNEIPSAFYGGDGNLEQFLILNPEPGEYRIVTEGLGQDAALVLSGPSGSSLIESYLAVGEMDTTTYMMPCVSFATAPHDTV